MGLRRRTIRKTHRKRSSIKNKGRKLGVKHGAKLADKRSRKLRRRYLKKRGGVTPKKQFSPRTPRTGEPGAYSVFRNIQDDTSPGSMHGMPQSYGSTSVVGSPGYDFMPGTPQSYGSTSVVGSPSYDFMPENATELNEVKKILFPKDEK